jgi:hypothetical protein
MAFLSWKFQYGLDCCLVATSFSGHPWNLFGFLRISQSILFMKISELVHWKGTLKKLHSWKSVLFFVRIQVQYRKSVKNVTISSTNHEHFWFQKRTSLAPLRYWTWIGFFLCFCFKSVRLSGFFNGKKLQWLQFFSSKTKNYEKILFF